MTDATRTTKHSPTTALSEVPEEKRVRLVSVEGGEGMNARLSAMGLLPGIEVEVLRNSGGPVLLAVRQSRIAIGRGMASKIRVR